MDANFHTALQYTLNFEGGFCNIPQDPGGPTNKGITIKTFENYCAQIGRAVPTVDDLKAISDEDVQALYYHKFWVPCGAPHLPTGVDTVVWDWGVNSGPSAGIKGLQHALGLSATGKLDQATIDAANATDPDALLGAICDLRSKFFYALVAKRPASSRFLKGWLHRVSDLRAIAHRMTPHGEDQIVGGKAGDEDHEDLHG